MNMYPSGFPMNVVQWSYMPATEGLRCLCGDELEAEAPGASAGCRVRAVGGCVRQSFLAHLALVGSCVLLGLVWLLSLRWDICALPWLQ